MYKIFIITMSFISGLFMIVYPENTNLWVIRGVGVLWIIDAIPMILEYYRNYLIKNKK